jgi:predicted amidohydrolase YtcJ
LLDSLGFDNPIGCIHQSGHIGVYNTVAMQRAGVLSADYTVPEGGMAGRDSEGHLTGYFEETARHSFRRVFASADPAADMEKGILMAQDMYIRQGFTTVQDGSSGTAA